MNTRRTIDAEVETTHDKVALVDLDGTVADYDLVMAEELKKLASYSEILRAEEGEHLEQRRKLVRSQPGFFRNLPRLELGFDVVNILRQIGFDLVVLTKASIHVPGTWQEKVEWSLQHLPDASITITGSTKSPAGHLTKGLVYGRVLVDDWPEYFNAWLKHRPRGLVIAVAHPWNEGYDSDPRVIRYDGKNLEQVREALKKAYDR